ncbi:DUF4402 domain-containing protein [Erythrobacter gaetbuli]|uniref:DUF4402 domain-containing protein n=1 Tax=Qipengyuania gaetbuli TaxID=266952 RepID=A0A844XYT5_9SPHN|nr:DUF4402 domain-containing protein [Qipengyuania gaetbuli]
MAVLLWSSASAALAEPGNSAFSSGKASAEVIEPLSVRAERDLNFGKIQHPSAATRTVIPNESTQSGGSSAARFRVTGAALRHYGIMIPSQVDAEGLASGAKIPVRDIQAYSKFLNATGERGRLDAHGRDVVYVGGTIDIEGSLPEDVYSAEILISVAYD